MRRNLAERAGRWSAAHWKTATFGWLAFVLAAVVLGQALGTVQLTDSEQSSGEAARAEQALNASGLHRHATETVLVRSDRRRVSDAPFRVELANVEAALRARPEAIEVRGPFPGRTDQIAKDRRAVIVQFDLRGSPETSASRVAPVLAEVERLQRSAAPGFTVAEFGDASAQHELNETTGRDFSHAEGLTVPVTFLVLLLAFGAFVAAGIPVLLAFSAVLAALGLSAIASHVFHASGATSSVLLLIGMAVGVDYSLFYLKREREERRGSDPGEALARAAATSGRAILVSGTTVLIAMAGMLLAGSKIFASIGVGAMIVVFVTMVGSVTVLPALLGRLGDRVERGVVAVLAAAVLRLIPGGRRPRRLVRLRERPTILQRLRRGDGRGESRLWKAVLGAALRRPGLAVVGTSALLIALAVPALGMHTRLMTYADLPHGLKAASSYEQIQRAFPGTSTPAAVVVQARDVTAPPVSGAIADLRRLAAADPQLGGSGGALSMRVNARRDLAEIEVPLAGNGDDRRSYAALARLRDTLLPSTIGRVPGASFAVTGQTAGAQQFNEVTKSHWPLVFAFVLGLAFLLLLATFRSLVIGATAIVLNLLSVGAAYGVLVWIFQDGHLQGLLGFHSSGAIVTWLPLFLFAVLFGLSMDYHVFIVSRIKELADRGHSTEQAVWSGIAGTAGTVTAAAAVMVAVFAVFATVSTLEIKQMGVGLAVAVLLDATVVRAVLLPASMKLLGRWNWYLPRWLQWLPSVRGEGGAVRPLPEAG